MRIGRNFLVLLFEAAILSASYSFTTRAGEEPAAPRRMAEAAMEAERDQRHREKMRIVWPKDIPDCPDGSEVYLIDGHIDYRCRRLTWDGKEVRTHTAECKRTWFYNAKGESFEATTSALDLFIPKVRRQCCGEFPRIIRKNLKMCDGLAKMCRLSSATGKRRSS